MNPKVLQTINDFVSLSPKYIKEATHCTDMNLVFNIAIATFEQQDTISEVKELLTKKLHDNEFAYADELSNNVSNIIDYIVNFLRYHKSL